MDDGLLAKLTELKTLGILTEAEFIEKKNKLIAASVQARAAEATPRVNRLDGRQTNMVSEQAEAKHAERDILHSFIKAEHDRLAQEKSILGQLKISTETVAQEQRIAEKQAEARFQQAKAQYEKVMASLKPYL